MKRTALFDLDGTLADTAPNLVQAFYRYCDDHQHPRPDFKLLRAQISNGVYGMLRCLQPALAEVEMPAARAQIVAYYGEDLASATQLFPGTHALLDAMDDAGIRWGIVTNKPDHLTQPLLRQLQIHKRAGCIVSGDSTPHSKPHPGSILHATELLGVAADRCLYVGDAERDVQASRAAGMPVVIVGYGYIDGHDVDAWQADGIIAQPLDLLPWLLPCS